MIFGWSNYLIYILELIKTIVIVRENGENKWIGF
jgi:hypothetical protein